MATRLRRGIVGVVLAALIAPGAAIVALRWVPAPGSSFMLQARLGGIGATPACAQIEHGWVGWQQIAAPMKLAVVAAEDQRFPSHWGFDIQAIQTALRDHARGAGLRGASTISQQVAKNLFLWPGRSLLRKGSEAYLTVWIEVAWSKRRILETYLNVAQFGPCLFGVEAAAQRHFERPAAALSPRQAALLAAVLPSPTVEDLRSPPQRVRERSRWIETQMRRLGGESYLHPLEAARTAPVPGDGRRLSLHRDPWIAVPAGPAGRGTGDT